MRVRPMTVGELRATLRDHSDWQVVTVAIEADDGDIHADLAEVHEHARFDGSEVTLVMHAYADGELAE